MSDLAQRIDNRIQVLHDGTYRGASVPESLAELKTAVYAALELAETLDDGTTHACGNVGDPNCGRCCARDIRVVIARAMGITELTTTTTTNTGDRVEWNPTGDTWEPSTVVERGETLLRIQLDENGQQMNVHPRHTRPEGSSEENK